MKCLAVIWIAFWVAPAILAAERPPSIIIILADDLGAGDPACFDPLSKIPTPNIDKLAGSGMKFTAAYCPVSVCSPSRYALMTGAYPARSWKKRGVLGNWDKPMIAETTPTLPGLLREGGYETAGFGKWHLGASYATSDGQRPVGEGKFKGAGSGSNIDIAKPLEGGPCDRGFDRWSGMICSSELLFVEDRKVTATVAHASYEALPVPGAAALPKVTTDQLLAKATAGAAGFIRNGPSQDRKPFFLYFAPYVPHIPLSVDPAFRGTTRAGDYGDYVHQLDHAVGQLLSALDETGQRENTLVVFASDNGSQFEKTGDDHHPNGTLRGGKWSIYEGGTRTPLVISWPGRIRPGSTSEALVALMDIFPTLAAATGRSLPEGSAPDGVNQLPLLLGEAAMAPRKEVVTQSADKLYALRSGDWKYISRGKGRGELYDLSSDPSEKRDLSKDHHQIAQKLALRLQEIISPFSRR